MSFFTKVFGTSPVIDLNHAAVGLGGAFKRLREEFFERSLEALQWNIGKGKLVFPLRQTRLDGKAEISCMAYQEYVSVCFFAEANYLPGGEKNEQFFSRLAFEVAGLKTKEVYEMAQEFLAKRTDLEQVIPMFAAHLALHIAGGEWSNQLIPAGQLIGKIIPCFSLRVGKAIAVTFHDRSKEQELSQAIEQLRKQGRGY